MNQAVASVVQAVHGAPHATWWYVRDPWGTLWLHFSCARCGDTSKKQCGDQRKGPHWARYYAGLHAH